MIKVNGPVNTGHSVAQNVNAQTLDINKEISKVAQNALNFLNRVKSSAESSLFSILNSIKKLPDTHPLKKIYTFFQGIFAPKVLSVKQEVKPFAKAAALAKYEVDEKAVLLLGLDKQSVLTEENIEMLEKVVEDDQNGFAAILLGSHYERMKNIEKALYFYGVSLDEKYYPCFGNAIDAILEHVRPEELTQDKLKALKVALREAEGAGVEIDENLFTKLDVRLAKATSK